MFRKELRMCDSCKRIFEERELRKHYETTGHASFTIFDISIKALIEKVLELTNRVEQIEEKLKRENEKEKS